MYASQTSPSWKDKKAMGLLDICLALNQLGSHKRVSFEDKPYSV
jgi:hypothetical protein